MITRPCHNVQPATSHVSSPWRHRCVICADDKRTSAGSCSVNRESRFTDTSSSTTGNAWARPRSRVLLTCNMSLQSGGWPVCFEVIYRGHMSNEDHTSDRFIARLSIDTRRAEREEISPMCRRPYAMVGSYPAGKGSQAAIPHRSGSVPIPRKRHMAWSLLLDAALGDNSPCCWRNVSSLQRTTQWLLGTRCEQSLCREIDLLLFSAFFPGQSRPL
jgi:hypothetical protein